jgi:hypothetical protein
MTIKPKPAGPARTQTRVDWVWVRVRVPTDSTDAGLRSIKPAPETQNHTRLYIKLLNYPLVYIPNYLFILYHVG